MAKYFLEKIKLEIKSNQKKYHQMGKPEFKEKRRIALNQLRI